MNRAATKGWVDCDGVGTCFAGRRDGEHLGYGVVGERRRLGAIWLRSPWNEGEGAVTAALWRGPSPAVVTAHSITPLPEGEGR
jgi:hypothetical protein